MITVLISDAGLRPRKVKGFAQGRSERASDSRTLFDILPFRFLLETYGQPILARKLNGNGFLGILYSGWFGNLF